MSDEPRSVEERLSSIEERIGSIAEYERKVAVAEDRARKAEKYAEDLNERQVAQTARAIALSTVVEHHLALLLLERGPILEAAIKQALRNAKPSDLQFQSDLAAAWWSDVVVQLPQHMEALLARLEQVLHGLRGAAGNPPS